MVTKVLFGKLHGLIHGLEQFWLLALMTERLLYGEKKNQVINLLYLF